MTFLKTSILSAVSVSAKILCQLVINKVLAFYIGPVGFATIGQFQNLLQMVNMLATGGINTGITKYTAQNSNDPVMQKQYWQTGIHICCISSLCVCTLCIVFRSKIENLLLLDTGSQTIIWVLSCALFLVSLNSFLLAILNGLKEIKKYVLSNILSSLFTLFFVVILTVFFGLYGALLSLVVSYPVALVFTIIITYKSNWLTVDLFLGSYNVKVIKALLKFSSMTLVSVICVPLSQIIVRSYISKTMGIEQAGNWEAINRISMAYLLVMGTALSVYLLPKFAELNDRVSIKNEIFACYKILIPFTIFCGVVIFFSKDIIVFLLLTGEFKDVSKLFFWQIFGDFFKICSWVLGYLILSKAMQKTYIISEIFFSLLYIGLSITLVLTYGLVGATLAYALTYGLYWIFVVQVTRSKMLKI